MRVNSITKFLQWCAGGDAQLLIHATASDRIKMTSLGVLVFGSALLAFASVVYFFMSGVGEPWSMTWTSQAATSVLAASCWFLIVLNLCRVLITVTGYGDGTSRITAGELKNSPASLVLALVFSLSTGVPLAVALLIGHSNGISTVQMTLLNERNYLVDQQYSETLVDEYIGLLKLKQQAALPASGSGKSVKLVVDDTLLVKAQARTELLREKIARIKQENFDQVRLVAGFFSDAEKVWGTYPGFATIIVLICALIYVTPPLVKLIWVKGPYENLVELQNDKVLKENGVVVDGATICYLVAEEIFEYQLARQRNTRIAFAETLDRHLSRQSKR